MKNSIKIVTVVFAILLTGTFISKSIKANVAPGDGGGGTKKLVACAINTEGGTIQYGNTCESGTKVCISNPCGQ